MKIYENFSVDDVSNDINISKELTLSSSGIGFKCENKPNPPPPSTDYKIICKGPGSSVRKDQIGCYCSNVTKVNCSFTCLNSNSETVNYNNDDEEINNCRLNNSTLIRGCGENSKGFTSDITATCKDDPCNPNPCKNGGLCRGNKICTCTRGYTGQYCEINPVMYNCCTTTHTCNEDDHGKHILKSLCNSECKNECPDEPPPSSRSVWCNGSNVESWTSCLMNDPNDLSYTKVNIPSCGVGDCNICKIVKEGDGQHGKCSQDATIYMKSVTDKGKEIGACKYKKDQNYSNPIDIPKTDDSISRDDFCDSSQCNYETNDAPTITNDINSKNLEFQNKSGNTIYVGFIVETVDTTMNPNATAYIGSNLNTLYPHPLTNIYKKNNVYFYEIPINNSLYFTINHLIWKNGNAVVLKDISNIDNDFNYVGLTNLEWTFINDNASMDISAVTGFNISCDLSIYNASQCDGLKTTRDDPNKISCNLNDKMKTNCSISNCFAPGYGNNTITSEGKQLQENILSDTNNNCGKDDCIKCPTGPDRCFDINVCNQSGKGQDHSNCYANNIRDRWGCYLWWNNPDNKMAVDWLNKFDDNCPIYGWTYDELVMYFSNYQTDKKNWVQTSVNCDNQDDRPPWPSELEYTTVHPSDFCDNCDSYKNSQLYKCLKGLETNIENCKGLIRHNKNKVLTTCSKITDKTLLRFTINSVM